MNLYSIFVLLCACIVELQVVRGFTERQNMFVPSKFISCVEADAPTTKLYRFHGALIHPTGERVPISTECLLLRESRLKVRSPDCSFISQILIKLLRSCRIRTTLRALSSMPDMKQSPCWIIVGQGTNAPRWNSKWILMWYGEH